MTLFDNIVLYSTIATGVLLALVVAPIIILAWLRPILFKIALRNVQRRLLQSVLIIFGLTISTAVIGVSLNIGDTFYTSVRQNVFDTYGFTDIVIAPGQNEFQINADGQAAIEDWAAAEPDVDGALPLLITSGGALIDNQRVFRAAPIVELVGYDATKLTGFEGLRGADGAVIDLANLSGADVVLSAELATILEAQVGDTIQYVLTPAETAGAAGAAQAEGDVLLDGQVREEREVLEQHAYAAPLRRERRSALARHLAVDPDAALADWLEAGDAAQGRALAGSARPHQASDGPLPERERYVRERRRAAVAVADPRHLEQRRIRRHLAPSVRSSEICPSRHCWSMNRRRIATAGSPITTSRRPDGAAWSSSSSEAYWKT